MTTAPTKGTAIERGSPSDLLGGLVLAEVFQLAEALARTTMVPKALQGRKDDILAIILRGRELGLPPMAALNSLQVINGRTGINSETLLGLVRKSPLCLRLELKESTAKRATYTYLRRGQSEPRDFTFTIEQAQTAGLIRNDSPWRTYPEAMLRARCASALVKAEFSDVLMGGVYDTDSAELEESLVPAPERQVNQPPPDYPPAGPPAVKQRKAKPKAEPEAEAEVVQDAPESTPPAPEAPAAPAEEPDELERLTDEVRTLVLEGAYVKAMKLVGKAPVELRVQLSSVLNEARK